MENGLEALPVHGIDDNGRFFRKLDWSAFWTATVVSFVVYCASLAPTVSLEDSGELAVAGDYLGVPHPPGYPIWSTFAWIFTKVFFFVRFRGQPNPAWSIGLMSAVFGALATGITAMLICRSGSDILRESRHSPHAADPKTERMICWVGGVVSSLLFAFSPVMWSQAVIVEVYSLNALFLVLIFLLVYMWMRRPSDKVLFATAFIFGLGLTNYQALLLAALPLVLAVALRDTALSRDFIIVAAPFGAVLFLIKIGVLSGIQHPTHISCFIYLSLNFLVLALAFFFLPRGKTVAITVLLAELGLAYYAYMPIVSELRNPPMNWGYPRTWEGFQHAISRGQYERIAPTDIFSFRFIEQLGTYMTDLRRQFTLPVVLLGFLPFTVWQVEVRGRRLRATYAAIGLCLVAAVLVVLEKMVPGQAALLARTYKLLIACVIVLMVMGASAIVLLQIREQALRIMNRVRTNVSERVTAGLLLFSVLAGYMYYAFMLSRRIITITAPLRDAQVNVAGEQLGDLLLSVAAIVVLIVGPVLLAALVAWLMRSRLRLTTTIAHESRSWILATLAGFVAMGVVFIALANLKMDIQDTFIQRVKFISSHALYTFWIGYGLIFGLAFVDVMFKGRPLFKWMSLCTAMALPLLPLEENWINKELLRVYGGAEQNGHDFGWQFGNYQLRGADAITEELESDEEPLPNPSFPPEMGRDAIFFGGTDPGRFVPTYMIYSARVREDVYLITQNALADNTYMSVMRDLYGDQIWIPAQPDSTHAFRVYVEEVQSGKRPRNAQLKIENGRVQVSGALGVMEINGILARMIFDRNNYRHAFYVEESYVIPWMYPYLTPHGLIMKINNNHTPLDTASTRNDLDFWDWYTRRFSSSDKFMRDVVARKSFSKLRSAIGGLYRSRGMLTEAEIAFQQARILYPLSPEANFRLAQEVLVPKRRLDEARWIMNEFGRADPANPKVPEFLGRIKNLDGLFAKIGELEGSLRDGKLPVDKALELAGLYRNAGQMPRFMQMVMGIVGNTNLPPILHYRAARMLFDAKRKNEMLKALDVCFPRLPETTPPDVLLDIARMYGSAGRGEGAVQAMSRYLAAKPNDWNAWLNLAALQIQMGRKQDASRSMERAVRIGGSQAHAIIRKDRRFLDVYEASASRARDLMGIPKASGLSRP
ncbi:MAG: DUF2723 domain-containing protein [Lentisphaerae bacterium]|nr:DUF2723 domain-containing protein [Lentisphaerota bacterium]